MNDSIAMRNYLNWLNADLPRETKQELRSYLTKPDEVISRFSEGLDFGTAGLRAVMELGTARMNEYSVAEAAMAIAQCVIEQGRAEQGIVISYDSRNNSRLYAETIARVTAEAGLRVYFSDEIRPVPMLSFAVRKYGAACGVMVTASHNPPEYNGIKVYGADGGQVRPEAAARIKDHMGSTVHAFSMVKSSESLVQLIYDGRVTLIGSDLDSAYEEYLLDRLSAVHQTVPAEARENVRIIYTPLNGAGAKPVRRILTTLGFKSVFVPPEQAEPDGDFPTLRVPNPEFPDTFDVAIKYAKMSMADVIIATDPDSDRLGVAVPNAEGEYEVLTGNQIGILLMEYLLSRRSAADGRRLFCVNSIVSSGLAERICMHHNVKLYRTLTGSKYVADLIERGGDTGTETFLFGFEEGHGYMFGAVEPDGGNESIAVRDKDAIFGAVLIAEMAALSKGQRLRLFDQFQSLYNFYGYGYEKTVAITRDGLNGKTRIADYMAHFREDGPAVGDIPINKVTDYLPESNVLYYELGNKSDWVAIRPSGTEPKLKIYVGCYGTKAAAAERCEQIAAMLEQQIREIDSQQEQLGARPAAI